MKKQNIITRTIKIVGLQPLAETCGVTYQAVQGWEKRGCLPRTEWTGETDYRHRIATATAGEITVEDLLTLP